MCGREQAALEGSRRGGALLQQLRERAGARGPVLLELRTAGTQGRSRAHARGGRADVAAADVATTGAATTGAAIPASPGGGARRNHVAPRSGGGRWD